MTGKKCVATEAAQIKLKDGPYHTSDLYRSGLELLLVTWRQHTVKIDKIVHLSKQREGGG